jgi:hypothetical protein
MNQKHRISGAVDGKWLRALQRAIWPVVACIGGEWQPPGTGFFVGKEGLLITARHIIEPAAVKRGRFLNAQGKWDNEGQFFAVGPKTSALESPQSPHLLPIAIVGTLPCVRQNVRFPRMSRLTFPYSH